MSNEYLWPVLSDKAKMALSLKPGQSQSVYASDAMRCYNFYDGCDIQIPLIYQDVYGSFLEAMTKNKGYIEYDTGGDPNKRRLSGCAMSEKGATLFVFPWDWRYGIANAVDTDEVDKLLHMPADPDGSKKKQRDPPSRICSMYSQNL